jgi:hypothetical protein
MCSTARPGGREALLQIAQIHFETTTADLPLTAAGRWAQLRTEPSTTHLCNDDPFEYALPPICRLRNTSKTVTRGCVDS